MPPALSETVIRTPPETTSSTARVILGATPDASQASKLLSRSSLATTSAKRCSPWPVMAVRARASTYCAALDVLNVVLCSLLMTSLLNTVRLGYSNQHGDHHEPKHPRVIAAIFAAITTPPRRWRPDGDPPDSHVRKRRGRRRAGSRYRALHRRPRRE